LHLVAVRPIVIPAVAEVGDIVVVGAIVGGLGAGVSGQGIEPPGDHIVRKERPHPVAFLPLVIMPIVHSLSYEIPTRPTVTFYLYRDAFIALAESAVSEVQSTGRVFHFPESPLYESAEVGQFSSKALVVEFTFSDFYLPLVYEHLEK